jgi:hypothetical protein
MASAVFALPSWMSLMDLKPFACAWVITWMVSAWMFCPAARKQLRVASPFMRTSQAGKARLTVFGNGISCHQKHKHFCAGSKPLRANRLQWFLQGRSAMKQYSCNTHLRLKANAVHRCSMLRGNALKMHNPIWNDGAQKRTRTSTTFRSPAPEAGASTNFAIWALGSIIGLVAAIFRSHPPEYLLQMNVSHA